MSARSARADHGRVAGEARLRRQGGRFGALAGGALVGKVRQARGRRHPLELVGRVRGRRLGRPRCQLQRELEVVVAAPAGGVHEPREGRLAQVLGDAHPQPGALVFQRPQRSAPNRTVVWCILRAAIQKTL